MEKLPGHGRARAGVEDDGILFLRLVVHDTILAAEIQLFFSAEFLCDVMQDPGGGRRIRILPPGLGKHDRLALAADHMRDALRLKIGVGLLPQPAQLRQRVIPALADDEAVHPVVQKSGAQAQLQSLPDLARAHLERCVCQQCDARAVLRPELTDLLLQLAVVEIVPRKDGQSALREQILELIPLIEAEQHVRPDDEGELILRITLPQEAHGVGGVALPHAARLDIRDDDAWDVRESQAAELQPLRGRRTVLVRLLVRGDIVRNDKEYIRFKLFANRAGGLGVAEVRRVEAAAVDRDPHAFSDPSPVRSAGLSRCAYTGRIWSR